MQNNLQRTDPTGRPYYLHPLAERPDRAKRNRVAYAAALEILG